MTVTGIRLYQSLFFYRRNTIKYEERVEPTMVGFDYQPPENKLPSPSGSANGAA